MKTMLATLKSTSTKEGAGSFEAVLSVPTFDRDKEIVDAGAFDPLPDHITIDIDHAMSVEKTIGSGRPYYDGAILRFEGTYASTPLAQMVRTLVDEGHIRTMSVAYMDSVYEVDHKDGLQHLRKAELLNAGIVGIPANREALITASKSLVAEVLDATVPVAKTGARHSSQDLSLLQSAHDALTALGAACAAKASPTGDGTTTTDFIEKAPSVPVETSTPTEPAGPRVDVVTAKARASAAAASLALINATTSTVLKGATPCPL